MLLYPGVWGRHGPRIRMQGEALLTRADLWGSAPHAPSHFFGRPKKWEKEMRQGSPLGSPISVGDRVADLRSLCF